jgi:hypothetical protein
MKIRNEKGAEKVKAIVLLILQKAAKITALGISAAMYLAGIIITMSFINRPFAESIQFIWEGLTHA